MPFHRLNDGTPLYYEDEGPRDGRAIVLIPGWTFTTSVWRRQVAALAADNRVISFDLRGAGRSGKGPARHSLADYAADAASLLEALEIKKAVAVGWALGASVAAYLATGAAGGRVAGVVWVDHSPCFFAVPEWPYALYGDLTAATLAATVARLHADRPAVTSGLLTDIFSLGLSDADRDGFYSECFQTPAEIAAQMLLLVAQADLRPMLSALSCPTLIVNGRQSVVPHAVGAWMEGVLPNGRAVVLEGAGHAPFWDQPAAFNAAVQGFAAGL